MSIFIGRKEELKKLGSLERLGNPSLVVIKGRRRIGKSRLVAESAANKIFLSFTGLAPIEGITAQDQRNAFAKQLSQQLKTPYVTFPDWSDAFAYLTLFITQNPTVILFDEISWMGNKDRTFLPKLKVWWDLTLPKYLKLSLILCGSVSTWIEENIINSTAFFGRISLQINLEELSLKESYQLLQERGFKGSIYDVCKILAITGGVPWYLDQILAQETADENIKRLCFTKDGLLVGEFDKIFHDLFSRKGAIYKKIIHLLSSGMKTLADIRKELNYPHSGSLSKHLQSLIISGFISEHYSWTLKTGKMKRQSLFRLSDNYTRFFNKYIEPNLLKIARNSYASLSLNSLPNWETVMGFQMENLILKNRHLLIQKLGLHLPDIVTDNPYIQKATSRHSGCQIDYLLQTQTNNLFICEFKLGKRELSTEVVEEMQNRIKRFMVPHGFGICPVLVHLSGVNEAVYDKNYFYRIIDFTDFLLN